MRIVVKVKPRAKVEQVEQSVPGHFSVRVKAPPADGKANEAVIALLARYFNVPKSHVRIASGNHRREKIIEILPR